MGSIGISRKTFGISIFGGLFRFNEQEEDDPFEAIEGFVVAPFFISDNILVRNV